MTEYEIITALHKACIEISYIDNIHIRELFTMLLAKEFDMDYELMRAWTDRERKARFADYKRRV